MTPARQHVIRLENLGQEDVARVGGKNASLGEMVRNLSNTSVHVPPGFATTAAYREYVEANRLNEIITDSFAALFAEHVSGD